MIDEIFRKARELMILDVVFQRDLYNYLLWGKTLNLTEFSMFYIVWRYE